MSTTETKYPKLTSTRKVVTTIITRNYALNPVVGLKTVETNGTLGEPELTYKGKKLKNLGTSILPCIMTAEFPELLKAGVNPWWDWGREYGFKSLAVSTSAVAEENNVEHLYFAASGCQVLFDANERIVPILLQAGYINEVMTNGNYRLEELVEHLKQHPWVVQSPRKEVLDGIRITGDLLKIKDVPYYNVSKGCKRYIEFLVLPHQDTLQKLFDLISAVVKPYWSISLNDAIFKPYYFPEDTPLGQSLRGLGLWDPLGLMPFYKGEEKKSKKK